MQRNMGRAGRGFLTDEEKANRPKVTGALLKRIGLYLKPYIKQLLLVLLCIILSSALSLLPSILTGRMIDEGLIGKNLPALIRLILLSLAVMIGANVIGVAESYLNTWIAQHITFDMRNSMFRHLLNMSHRFFTKNGQGDIITRMTSDISGVQQVVSSTLTNIITNVITLVIALIAMYRKNWILATMGILLVPLFILPTKRVGKTRWSLTLESQKCNDTINGILNETLSVSGQLLVKLFNKEDYEYGRYREANEQMVRLNVKESMAGRWFRVAISSFSSIGPLLIYLVGGIIMMKHDPTLSVGDITVLVSLLGRMYGPVNSLLNIQVDWIRSMAMFTRIFDYMDMPAEIKNAENPIVPTSVRGEIVFDHVDFAYESDRPILKNVNFSLQEGKSIAIVGKSGSGKSTIINLITRLYDVNAGRVLFDNVDVRDLDLAFLRGSVGVVTQETYLFNDTIYNNLLYANPNATREEVVEACKTANIHDFIAALPDGYDTQVGNRGLKLSGGEKQRLSIARVLLKDPAVLVFDEATSSLDSISEKAIQDAIDPLIAQRTSIIIAHRLSTILAADEILVVNDGQIIEKGRHSDLLAANGVYKELYETQFRRALDADQAAQASGVV
ncbi:MAG: ABC transporter ATP-binding protein [Clostridia bacterium]|nr:ABC transporter ATP-binding protein [Clostridia bacterium]